MNNIESAIKIAQTVAESINLVSYDPKDYYTKYAQRSPKEILKSKKTNYSGNCLDLTFTTIALLRQAGFNPNLVIEKRIHPRGNFPTVHFAIELVINKEKYTIDFQSKRNLIYYKGKFNTLKIDPKMKVLEVKRMRTNKINLNTTPLEFFGATNLTQIAKKTGVDTKKIFENLKKERDQRIFKRLKRTKPKIKRL